MADTVSQTFLEPRNTTAHPGAKVECMFCGHSTYTGFDSDTNKVTVHMPEAEPIGLRFAKKSQNASLVLDCYL